MGRRSQHSPDELRQLILEAAQRIVATRGFSELSAREIAREIGYAPGTLYNLFRNLDEILLRVEAELLDRLDKALSAEMEGRKGSDAVRRFAVAYAAFAYEHTKLWHLVQEHHPAVDQAGPDWYLEKVYAPASRLEIVLAKLSGNQDVEEAARTARIIWSAVHGIVQVAMTGKFGALPQSTTVAMVENLVENYLVGLAASASKHTDGNRSDSDRRSRGASRHAS